MAYETGTTTGFSDLVTRIETFAVANGWTKTGNVIHKGDVYVKMSVDFAYISSVNRYWIKLEGGTGVSAGELTGATPAGVKLSEYPILTEKVSLPATYHIFSHVSPDFLLVVLNANTTDVQWLTFGSMEKYGTWNGGTYIGAPFNDAFKGETTWNHSFTTIGLEHGATDWSNGCGLWMGALHQYTYNNPAHRTYYGSMMLRCDLEANIDASGWLTNSYHTGYYPPSYPASFNGSALQHEQPYYQPNTFNNQTTLTPVVVTLLRPSQKISIIGNPVHVRYINMKYFNMGDIITLGTDKWMVFPHYQLDATDPVKCLGFAVKYDGP